MSKQDETKEALEALGGCAGIAYLFPAGVVNLFLGGLLLFCYWGWFLQRLCPALPALGYCMATGLYSLFFWLKARPTINKQTPATTPMELVVFDLFQKLGMGWLLLLGWLLSKGV